MVPDVEFTSYYGRPVIREPAWETPDIAGYLFLGGLAGVVRAGGRRPGVRLRRAGPGGQGGRARRDQPVRGGPGPRPRAAGPVRQHAAGIQANLADERRLLAAVRVRPGGRGRRGLRRDRDPACRRPRGHGRRGPARPGHRDLRRRADLSTPRFRLAWGYREMPYVFAGCPASAAGGLGLLAVSRSQTRPTPLPCSVPRSNSSPAAPAGPPRQAREQSLAEPYEAGTTRAILRAGRVR